MLGQTPPPLWSGNFPLTPMVNFPSPHPSHCIFYFSLQNLSMWSYLFRIKKFKKFKKPKKFKILKPSVKIWVLQTHFKKQNFEFYKFRVQKIQKT